MSPLGSPSSWPQNISMWCRVFSCSQNVTSAVEQNRSRNYTCALPHTFSYLNSSQQKPTCSSVQGSNSICGKLICLDWFKRGSLPFLREGFYSLKRPRDFSLLLLNFARLVSHYVSGISRLPSCPENDAPGGMGVRPSQ